MESIVSKALAKYFKKFIKDFKSEQFTVSLRKGTARLTDLELNGPFIQHVMMIPPNTEIRHCSCNELTVNIPNVTKFNEKPVILTMDKIFLTLEEPEVIKPIPTQPKTSHKKKKSLSGSPMGKRGLSNFVRDMKIVINEAHFTVKLLPRDEPNVSSSWAPHLRFDLHDIVIESTDGEWKVMKLSKTVVKDSDRKLERAFKLAMCRSVSVSLVSETNSESVLKIVEKLPVEIHITTETSIATGQTLSVDLHCILDDVRFSWNQISWSLVVKLFSSLRFCLEREIPREIKEETVAKIKKQKKKVSGALDSMNMKYRLFVRTWRMAFINTTEDQEENGYCFEGTKLQFDISPKRRVGNREGDSLFESNLLLCVESFNFGEICPNPLKEAHVSKVISEIYDEPSGNEEFMSVAINHHWAKLNQPKSTNLTIKLNGLQIVLDREVMKGFYKFLSEEIISVAKEDHEREKMEKKMKQIEKAALNDLDGPATPNVEKQVEELISKIKPPKMSDYFYWFNSSDVRVVVQNTKVIIPKDYYVRADGVQLHRELRAYSKQVSFVNLARWDTVPHLEDALKCLPKSELMAFTCDGSPKSNKFQLEISDVVMDTLDPQKADSLDTILLPTTLKIYGRFIEKQDGVKIQPDMELSIHASEFKLTITEEQESYFKEMIPMYQRWYHKLDKEIKSVSVETKKEIKAKIQEGKKTALSVATKLAEANPKASEVLEKAKRSRARAVEDVIKSLMMIGRFQFAYSFQADLGSLTIPLHNIGDEHVNAENEVPMEDIELPLSSFTFKKMAVVVENTLFRQAVQVQLGIFEAKDLDHPKSPSSLALLPLGGANDFLEHKSSSLVLECVRERPIDTKPFTSVMVYLQGMKIVSQAKKAAIRGMHKELEAAIPDLKRIGQKITDTLIGLKQDQTKVEKITKEVDKVKKKMNKGVTIAEKALDFLDLSWAFHVSDCELVLLEHDWTPDNGKKPFGAIKVSSFNKEQLSSRFDDLNQDLITTKLRLAETDANMDSLLSEKRAQQELVTTLNKQIEANNAKAKNELESIEQQLIETKMSLVEAQIQIQELQSKLRHK